MKNNSVLNNGVLRQSRKNPRYFEDGQGKLVVLSGSHTWANMQDLSIAGEPPFDYSAYLNMLSRHRHNFIRMWQWGHFLWTPWTLDEVRIEPQPYERMGDDPAKDGLPKFDLDRWNESYFKRLRDRVVQAGERGIYVSVMFYDGWCLKNALPASDSWSGHPFYPANNVNGILGGNEDNSRARLNRMDNPEVLERQKAFIRKCIDTVNDLDNVLYEIINEAEDTEEALQWQYHMIDYVKQYESLKPKRHAIGMTAADGSQFNPLLFESNADWIAPGFGPEHEYEHNPPEADGSKVILVDTDHIWGIGGHYTWAWKTFMRGMQPIFMDPWGPLPGRTDSGFAFIGAKNSPDYPDWEPLRANMGYIRAFAERIDLARMVPHKQLSSTGYCLADPGHAYLVFAPSGNRVVQVDLRASGSLFRCEWFNPVNGDTVIGEAVTGGAIDRLPNPFSEAAVLYLMETH